MLWTRKEIEYLRANYKTMKYKDLALKIGRTEGSVRNKCHELKFRKKVDNWSKQEIKVLEQHYLSNIFVDLDLLSNILKRHKSNISRKARELELTDAHRQKSKVAKRNMSSNKKIWLKNNEHPKGYLGHSPSKKTRKTIGEKSRQAWADPNSKFNTEDFRQWKSDNMKEKQMNGMLRNSYSRGKMGKRSDLNNLYVRSSWEANYARYLNWLISIGEIKKWEYEPEVFEFEAIKRGARSYTPDFKVYNNNGSIEYHEVKGWMDAKSKTKLKRMNKYYPDIKIVLVDKDSYYAIARDVKRFIPNWE